MAPGKYTELFFLDEATALAAGHRPCAECFRPRFNEFVAAWAEANSDLAGGAKVSAGKVDVILHQERIAKRQKVICLDKLANLPSGTFVALEDKDQPYLVVEDALLTLVSCRV